MPLNNLKMYNFSIKKNPDKMAKALTKIEILTKWRIRQNYEILTEKKRNFDELVDAPK